MERDAKAPASLAEPLSLADYADLARAALGPAAWDFIAGGAGEERTLTANTAAFERLRLRPRVLAGLAEAETATEVLGGRWTAPLGVAPMAYHTLAHHEGELATVRAAGAAGLPVVVSTFAGRPFEELAAAAQAPLWLQVYCFRDREVTRRLIERAERAGFAALVLTVDAPRLGRRPRDQRNGFRLPPHVVPANLPAVAPGHYAAPAEHGRAALDPALDWSVLPWLRSVSRLPLLLKGVLTAEDAARAVASGVDGLVVSNHGGRQLDGAPATLDALREVTAGAAGRCPILLDGGVRRGADILAALSLGADAVLVGRPVLHGLAADGQRGVAGVLGILVDELREAMHLTGTPHPAAAGPWLVAPGTTPPPPAPASIPGDDAPLRRTDLHASLSDPVLDAMTFLNEIADRYPEAISFAPGRPHEAFYDTERLFGHLRRYVDDLTADGASPADVARALHQYGPTAGMPRLRQLIAAALEVDEGIEVPPEAVVVTVGAQEAMLLVLRALFADPRDVLLTFSPCYVGITGVARLLNIPLTTLAEGDEGPDRAALDAAVRDEHARGRRPRALYVVPDHSNPTGATLSLPARRELLAFAERHGLFLLEDSPYRLVGDRPRPPTLKYLDRAHRVVHLGSFAKTLFPGARVGYVVADQRVTGADGATTLLADELTRIKSMVTVNTPSLGQAAVAGALLASPDGGVARLAAPSAAHYAKALRLTLEQLARHFPARARSRLGVGWNAPDGGFFLTVRVAFPTGNAALVRSAEHHGVLWTPMSSFHPDGGGEHAMRLSVSGLPHERIEEGVARLAGFIEAETLDPRD
ncbi:aminotransferase class I/II-fold pyridoxal phosphate-dependent enzyme [Streptomyces hainanensis]|uniref:Aminotransferase class I/II-fold pyridoxal phosphate-dependent enzyme n=1 Tax=Streptomyces hainanensis TaxID=402648 RepID=A0A4R4TKL2_9ACTN|nr:aminotransferase class I/II-fold pyridoxal phosphate-dependent enzyme [Streptomyces hainanensis]